MTTESTATALVAAVAGTVLLIAIWLMGVTIGEIAKQQEAAPVMAKFDEEPPARK
jgi:hypothetical protein